MTFWSASCRGNENGIRALPQHWQMTTVWVFSMFVTSIDLYFNISDLRFRRLAVRASMENLICRTPMRGCA